MHLRPKENSGLESPGSTEHGGGEVVVLCGAGAKQGPLDLVSEPPACLPPPC